MTSNVSPSSELGEGLTFETLAFQSLYGAQFTSSAPSIKPNYLVIVGRVIHNFAPRYIFDNSCPSIDWSLVADRMANLHCNEKIVIAASMIVVYRLEKTIKIQQLGRC